MYVVLMFSSKFKDIAEEKNQSIDMLTMGRTEKKNMLFTLTFSFFSRFQFFLSLFILNTNIKLFVFFFMSNIVFKNGTKSYNIYLKERMN